jgi:hypothetical protein
MTDQQAREFVEALAVPEHADPPPCPLCGQSHPLESKCRPADLERHEPVTASGASKATSTRSIALGSR